jgi:hypothetical protein
MPVAPEKTNANAAAPLTVVALAVAPEVTCWTPEPAIVVLIATPADSTI